MNISGRLLTSPGDFKQSLRYHDWLMVPLSTPPSYIEPQYRRCLADIFTELTYIDIDDPQLIDDYIENISFPLHTLHTLGYTVLAVAATGMWSCSLEIRVPDWRRTYFFIVKLKSYIRPVTYPNQIIHSCTPTCPDLLASLVESAKNEDTVQVWSSHFSVTKDFEHSVPWCPTCCLSEIVSPF